MTPNLRMPLLVLALLFATSITLVYRLGKPGRTVEPYVEQRLPPTVMDYQGFDVRYCHNEDCMAVFSDNAGVAGNECIQCGSQLHCISPSEHKILPPDTLIVKKRYNNPAGYEFFVSMVITGDQRASIHRPQWCLPGQGFAILSTETVDVALDSDSSLGIALLQIRKAEDESNSRAAQGRSWFAYWFVGRNMTTAYHWRRHLQAAFDSIFRGSVQRWAYVSVLTECTYSEDADMKRMKAFISELHELMVKKSAGR